ncbi:Lysophospholipid acyltransferase [Friedmanniomyces endolithicus]|nr:Lysophospholipid acyltransferase [Friedmanniomyces endolithicus]
MIPYINVPFDYVANLVGAPTDELKMIFLFLISYPLAGVLKRLPDHKPWTKNVFIISISIFYLVGLFDLWSGLALIVFDAVGAYLIAKYVEGPYMPWIGFSFLMGHMSISHIYRQMAATPSSVDITGAQMVMVMKLSAFCWNVFDGRQKASELNDDQKERMIVDLPAPLDFAGFVAFFPSIMIGPAFDYIDYHRWLNTSMFDLPPGTDPMKAPPTRKKRKIPRSATPAMWKMASGLLWVFAFLQFSNYFNKDVVLSDRYKNMGLLWRIFHLHMLSLVTRMKYYGAWSLTDGACTLSGIGYKGLDAKTGKPNWDRLINVRPAGVEFGQNSHAYLGNWNINTNHWLRNYMYLRVTPKGKKPGFRASMATFVTSAFWHGFYPGYYLTFVLASFIQNVAKSVALCSLFLASPGKAWLAGKAGARSGKGGKPGLGRTDSMDSLKGGSTLGVPSEPGREFDELVEEIMVEVKMRRGSRAGPEGVELRRRVEASLVEKSEEMKKEL